MTEAEFREQFIRGAAVDLMRSIDARYSAFIGTEDQVRIAYHEATALYLEHRRRFPEKKPQVASPKPVGKVLKRKTAKRYILQNRYQDSGWENLNEEFDHVREAVQRASEASKNSICYGMVRVVDMDNEQVVITFPAGVEPV